MSSQRRSPHGLWSSGPIFVLAVTGSAVGLGNVWKFPSMVGANGGGAFFLLYLLCLAVIGLPLVAAEIMLGRRGRHSPVNTMAALAAEEGRSGLWQALGWMQLLTSCLLLATYSVVGGWAMAYVFRAASGMFVDLDPLQAAEVFQGLIRDPERLLAWHTLFMAVTMMIVARGVRWGLEEAVRWFMPMLLGLLLLLAGYTAAATGYFEQAVSFLFTPNFEQFTWDSLWRALGHAFFTLSLGMGVVMTYGAYLPDQVSIFRASVFIVVADTFIAVLAGLVVFPVIFAYDLAATSGPMLTFQTLPLAFGQMPNGTWFGTLFFLLLMFAAWTSAIGHLEPTVAYLVERGMDRPLATSYVGVSVWALGIVSLLSFNVWEHITPLQQFEVFRHSTLFDVFNYVAANLLLPLGGLAVAVFAGWQVSRMSSQLQLGEGRSYRLWLFAIRFVTPIALLLVFAHAIGVKI
jgi:NSS family neurotransmitter:Na+ symporter